MGACQSGQRNPPELQHLPPPISKPIPRQDNAPCPPLTSFAQLTPLRVLGSGAVGTVILVRHEPSQHLYAVKMVAKTVLKNPKQHKRMQVEKTLLQFANHPFLAKLYWSFQTREYLFLVMHYYSKGSLCSLQLNQPNLLFTEHTIRYFASQIILALERLHLLGYIYRDIKSENLILCDLHHLVLVDFGLARQAITPELVRALNDPRKSMMTAAQVGPATSFVGTSQFVAPEVIEGDRQESTVDWWSLGILLYQLVYGKTPFLGEDVDDTFENIQHAKLSFPGSRQISRQLKALIRGLLRTDPKKRLGHERGAEELKEHAFFNGVHWELDRYLESPPAFNWDERPEVEAEIEGQVEDKDEEAWEYVQSEHEFLRDTEMVEEDEYVKENDVWLEFSVNVTNF